MAWWVVIGHWSTTAPIPHAIGHTKLYNGYAVDVFIILSGFAICALIDKRPESYGMFITRRILRIFPVYLFFLVLSALLAKVALDTWMIAPDGYMKPARIRIATDSLDYFWPHMGAHLVALHGLVPSTLLPSTDFAFLGPAWSISLEWQFYLIAPFMIAWLRPSSPLARLAWLLPLGALFIALSRFLPSGFIGGNLHNFLIGIFSYQFLKARFAGAPALQFPTLPFVVFGLPFLLFLKTPAVIPYAIWLLMMVTIIEARERESGAFAFASRILTHRWALKMGSMAYSVYLSHMLVIVASVQFLHGRGLGNVAYSIALLGMALVGTLIISTATYLLIEKPFHEFGRNLRWGSRQTVSGQT